MFLKSAAFHLKRGTQEDSYFPETSPYLRTFYKCGVGVLVLPCCMLFLRATEDDIKAGKQKQARSWSSIPKSHNHSSCAGDS
jgi:hypothetical protein